jgi:AraC family transcriptional regulator
MQNDLQVDSDVFPGNRQLKVWLPAQAQMDRRTRVAVERLHADLCTRTSVAELARSVNMSRWRFCHLFTIEMSESPSHYVGMLRMREAQKMLSETFLSIKEIRAKRAISTAATSVANLRNSVVSRQLNSENV